jgi:hypothetical protein
LSIKYHQMKLTCETNLFSTVEYKRGSKRIKLLNNYLFILTFSFWIAASDYLDMRNCKIMSLSGCHVTAPSSSPYYYPTHGSPAGPPSSAPFQALRLLIWLRWGIAIFCAARYSAWWWWDLFWDVRIFIWFWFF